MKLHRYKVEIEIISHNDEFHYDEFEVDAENEDNAQEQANEILFDSDTPQGMMYKHGDNAKVMSILLITPLD